MSLPRPLIHDHKNNLNLVYACPDRVDQLMYCWINTPFMLNWTRKDQKGVLIHKGTPFMAMLSVGVDGDVEPVTYNGKGLKWIEGATERPEGRSDHRLALGVFPIGPSQENDLRPLLIGRVHPLVSVSTATT